MRVLILVRHAKSSWEFGFEDKKRPLAERGISDIKKIGKQVKKHLPEQLTIWSSMAVRASHTARLFCENAGLEVQNIVFRENLYTFSESELEKEIKKCENTVQNLILFGHNEAITNFVNKFGDEYIENVPTAGFVYLQFEEDSWENINRGRIIKAVFPKDI
ncbi:histidine phosphatase family protein [Flavobacterium amniphilum]|uniref:SixA phosphatase family protein n=1 Tax=Flavobacterium amniphilum TaxID=1834035 RepID=UPI00202A074D|nr:histidine phosphatase family protein [Flavobacterium amniphilum]MCL9804243.1 histidine phosphatase family protein [Flavobacterium amniphilum]